MNTIISTPGTSVPGNDPRGVALPHHHGAGLSWAAIIGGVFLSMAVSIILVILGSALELSTVSPWSMNSGTVSSFSIKVAIWFIIVQWLSAGLGGYIAGRLRCKWHGLHTHEVFFRDTAHGLLSWAVATVLMTALFSSVGSSIVSGGVKAASTVAAGASMGAAQGATSTANDPSGYYIDTLLRSNTPNSAMTAQDQRMEITRIFANSASDGTISETDKAYLAQLIAARAGISQAEAEKRVNDTIAQINLAKQKALQDAELARKAALKISIYLVISMLIGGFVAGASAAYGGRQRDEY